MYVKLKYLHAYVPLTFKKTLCYSDLSTLLTTLPAVSYHASPLKSKCKSTCRFSITCNVNIRLEDIMSGQNGFLSKLPYKSSFPLTIWVSDFCHCLNIVLKYLIDRKLKERLNYNVWFSSISAPLDTYWTILSMFCSNVWYKVSLIIKSHSLK